MRRGSRADGVTVGLALCGLVPGLASAQAFEGVVRYTVHSEAGKTVDIVQMSKHGKLRQQYTSDGKRFETITDSAAGTMTIVNSEERTYIVLRREMMEQAPQGLRGTPADTTGKPEQPLGTVTRTNRTETVAGVTCDVYAYEGVENGKRETGELCVAKDVGALFTVGGLGSMSMARQPSMQERLRSWGPLGDLLARGHAILKITRNVNGAPVAAVLVTAIERRPLGDDQFRPPADYREVTVGGGRR